MTIRVTNFKAVGSAELTPTRLTVIAGANSSGKSSFVQSVLFFAQSFGQPQIVINGDLVRLGEPSDVLRDGAKEMSFSFSYNVISRDEQGQAREKTSFDLRISLAPSDEQLTPVSFVLLRDGAIVMTARSPQDPVDVPVGGGETALLIENAAAMSLPPTSYVLVAGLTPQRLVFRALEADLNREFEALLVEAQRGSAYALDELAMVARFAESEGATGELEPRLARARRRAGSPGGSYTSLSEDEHEVLLHAYSELQAPGGWRSELVASRLARGRPWRSAPAESPESSVRALLRIGATAERMERLVESILYLGPLRDDPRVAYPLGHTVRNLPVGEKGEFTAAYLERHKRTQIKYVTPAGRSQRATLWSAVSDWCRFLGIAENVTVTSQGKLGHQLGLRVGGQQRDPTAVGVGASQLLPVVVLVLGASDDATIFFEQPELHLHPKVQSRLGDFLAFAKPGVRLVVETHSEYLITRLRLRAAEGRLAPSDVAVLFASRREGTQVALGAEREEPDFFTDFARLNLDQLGDFDAWPQDFFDTLDRDTIDLAQAITQRLERKDQPDR
jgi:predicted ATPase